MASSAPSLQYNNIVFHHVPNHQAPGLLAAMLTFSFCLGVITLEILSNLRYDYNLIKRPGWREPVKASNRLSYFLCRYGCFVFMLITVIYMNLPGSNCHDYAIGINVMWVIPLITVDLIFVQRTLAVYNWNKLITIPLGFLYISYVALCTYSVVTFGYGYNIPGTSFCAYQTIPTSQKPHATVFICYIVLVILLDSLILLLTTHRLLEGGLGNLYHLIVTKTAENRKNKALRKAEGHSVGEVSLSGLLLRQGVGYFMLLELSRLAFLIVYYTVNNETSYQVLVSGILVLVGPVMAGMLFRQTSEAVKRAAISSSDRGQGPVLSQGRSYRSSMPTTPANFTSFTPLSPLSPTTHMARENAMNGQGHLVNPNLFTPISPHKGDSMDQDTIGTEYFGNERSRTNSDNAPLNGDQTISLQDPRGLQVYVEEKTDVESVQMSPMDSQQNHRGRFNLNPTEDSLPIHQQYARSNQPYFASSPHAQQGSIGGHHGPASNHSHSTSGHRNFLEDNVQFTPVLPHQLEEQRHSAYGSAQ
ncbi:uncharacterized protein FA14DRAFT_70819 [Meira miltonrushii]|uniref:Uncharacterized protein n=1 Tax=Meira miltonrushii TaxID=1280837 RepID=A0A316VDE2_9BASI|nr:uncharacterized protein FA14DRAFT_70819 [Meira miltonrushii]PWN34273.1 hypothetical protein FA14DRAFT_70819 [Meira miltonrushii]